MKNTETKKEILNLLRSLIDDQRIKPTNQLAEALILCLNLFNVLTEDEDNIFRLKSGSALNFLKSLEIYLKEDLNLISDWEVKGAKTPDKRENLFYGIEFLYEMENRRVHKLGSKENIEELDIIVLILKAKTSVSNEDYYLFQFDNSSSRFKIIGGRSLFKDKEDSISEILNRELPFNKFIKDQTYKVSKVQNEISIFNISTREGIYRKYNVSFYQVFPKLQLIKLASTDRWLTINDVKKGKTSDGIEIVSPFRDMKNPVELEKIFIELDLSTDSVQIYNPKDTDIEHKKLESATAHLTGEETERLEFKSSIRWDFKQNAINKNLEKSILKTICAFLNTKGGTLVIGVDDDKNVLGIDFDLNTLPKKNEDGYMQYLMQILTSNTDITVASLTKVIFEKVEGKKIAIIDVAKSQEPIFLKEGELKQFYIRVGNTSKSLNPEETYKYIQTNW